MNTWFVGNHPVGHHTRDLKAIEDTKQSKSEVEETAVEEKTFFMKARIMAGQADIKSKESDIEDFKWLAKEEIEKTVSAGYWSKIKNMLVEQ
jgi:large subunit ribosomal protein L46